MTSHRVISAAIFFAIFLLGLFAGPFHWIVLFVTLAGAIKGVWEFDHLGRVPPTRIQLIASVVGAFALILEGYYLDLRHATVIIGWVTILTLAYALTLKRTRDLAAVAGKALAAPLYVALPLAMILHIWRANMHPGAEDENAGAYYVLFLIIVTWSSDTGAYFTGRWFGKTKIAPRLSPGKTLEGYLGGVALTFIVAITMKAVWNNIDAIFGWWDVIVLAFAFSIIAPIGDLAESALKRSARVKDSGQTFTGHGGMLDIIDSLLFTAVFYYWYLGWIHPEALGQM